MPTTGALAARCVSGGAVVTAVLDDNRSTRDRILDAALTAFADRGVEASSLDFVAAEIGIRKQTILYWFPSKERLLLGVIDHAVAQLGSRLSEAANGARPKRRPSGASTTSTTHAAPAVAVTLDDRLAAVVDATFRLGTTHPQLLAVVREVTRVGPPASTHLAASVEPLIETALSSLPAGAPTTRVRAALLGAAAQVVGLATEAEVRADLGLAPDLSWLRSRRRELLASLSADLT